MITTARLDVPSITDTWRVLHATPYTKRSLLQTQVEPEINPSHGARGISSKNASRVHSIEPRTTASMAEFAVQECRNTTSTRSIPQYIEPKYCEYTKHLKHVLSEILEFNSRYWEHLCKAVMRLGLNCGFAQQASKGCFLYGSISSF